MSGAHPSLFFTADEIPALRDKCASATRSQLDALRRYADDHLDEAPPSGLHGGYEKRGDQIQDPFLARTLAYAFLAVVTDEERYFHAARRWALSLARIPDWVGVIDPSTGKCGNCGYPEGWGVTALAVAYDWLHPRLAEDERALLRDKIGAVCEGLHGGTLSGEWWTGAYFHHDTWIPIGGLGVGAMAVIDDLPDAPRWAERARAALDEALDWADGDGAWPEGPCGWAFAMISALPFWDAYRRRFPERGAEILAHPWLRRTAGFRIQSRTPDGRFLAFGDCQPHGGYQQNAREAAPTLRWLAARYRDGHAQWQAAREWETVPNPTTAAWEVLWMDPAVPEEGPEDLPPGELFENQGMAYLRTGWDERATVVALRCDSLIGRRAASLYRPGDEGRFNNSTTHVHADAGSFGVWSRGDFAVTMARYGQNGTAFQSSLLVDGQGQYERFAPEHVGRPDGRILAFLAAPGQGFASGEAAGAYPPLLERFRRSVYLVDPGLVFVVDDIAAPRPVELEWRFHADAGASLDLRDDGYESLMSGRRTLLRLSRAASLAALADDWNRGVAVRPGEPLQQAELCAALVPSLAEGAAVGIESPTPRSFVVSVLGETVVAAFAPGGGRLSLPGRLDGRGSAAVVAGGGQRFLVVDADRLELDGRLLFEASAPVAVAFRRDGRLDVLASAPVEVAVRAGAAVGSVRAVDGAHPSFHTAGGLLRVTLPPGRSRLSFRG